jgi:sugar phosphate isomerase/epimerase
MTRRQILAALAASVPPLWARKTIQKSQLSAITDEIGKTAADAITFAKQYGLQWVELRTLPETRKEYASLSEPEIKAAAAALKNAGLKVSFLNTGMLKFGWPGTEPVRRRTETPAARTKRLASEQARWDRRGEDLRKAINAAHIFGVNKVRIFTGSRVAEPKTVYARIADVLGEAALTAGKEKVHLLIENEGSCNIGTSQELADIMKLLPTRWMGINWDPQNGVGLKDVPWPDGYRVLPIKRVLNVQVKGKGVMPSSPDKLDWKSIMQALGKDGYTGCIGLETHIFDGTLIEAAHISIKEMLRIAGEL